MKPVITITYCARCRWMLRAAWLAQELLTTFEEETGSVALKPDFTGGVFEVHAGEVLVFSREAHGGFADLKVIKQRVRDHIAPGKTLGHADRPSNSSL